MYPDDLIQRKVIYSVVKSLSKAKGSEISVLGYCEVLKK